MTLGLYKGNILIHGRTSPNSLYDEEVASMEGGEATTRPTPRASSACHGLPSRVLGKARPRQY